MKKVPKGRSVTELEMWHGALRNPKATQALFYFRDDDFNKQVRPHLQTHTHTYTQTHR